MVASNGQLFKEKTQKIPPKPTVLEVIPENIPAELKAIPNWMCWCYELRQSNQGEWKWTKPPLQVNSRYARSDQPRTWTTFERVLEHYLYRRWDRAQWHRVPTHGRHHRVGPRPLP